MNFDDRRRGSGFPSQGIIIDSGGRPLDASGPVWILNDPRQNTHLKWKMLSDVIKSPRTFEATVRYIVRQIETKSSSSVWTTFQALCFIRLSPSFIKADESDDVIPAKFFEELRTAFVNADWRLHFFRDWYRSCANHGYEAFSAEVALELELQRVGGNPKGHAVLSLDPEEGPLTDQEIVALLNALNGSRRLPVDERAALWLCIAFGPNPFQLALLREKDIETIIEDNLTYTQIRIPRIKKMRLETRAECRVRKLIPEIAEVVMDLIRANEKDRDQQCDPCEYPLFARNNPRKTGNNGSMPDFERHRYSSQITELVMRAVHRLGVISPRTGKPLHVTVRRLRYTFATRLVREGASRREVADALDHSDLQNVHVYFDMKSDIVESLDKAMAIKLGTIAQAFLGTIVRSESEAARGNDVRSRIMFFDKDTGNNGGLGTCGEYSFCGKFAPIACYTCRNFQPWIDGPHHLILSELLARREYRRSNGRDGRMVSLYDATIYAISDVISRIGALKMSGAV